MPEETKRLIQHLVTAREKASLPPATRSVAIAVGESALCLLFPHFAESIDCDAGHIEDEFDCLRKCLAEFQGILGAAYPQPENDLDDQFIARLDSIFGGLQNDAEAIFRGDPAACSVDEVILAYPGFRAIATYRIAHEFQRLGTPLLPRLLTEWAHSLTGIDIHPGATIGHGFFIDHGTGIVVGETANIGNGVRLYQGVTLGALAVEKSQQGVKRHPTIEDNVVIYANATILGGETVIGHDSVIGGNAFLTSSIPPFSVVNRQSTVRRRSSKADETLDFHI